MSTKEWDMDLINFRKCIITHFMSLVFFYNPLKHKKTYGWHKIGYPADNCMFKVNNRNTRARCEICSKLTIKTPERRLASFWCLYC